MKLVGLIQWLSTAFMTVMVISWVSVGNPSFITGVLWGVQDTLVESAIEFADEADLSFPDVSAIREQEEFFAEEFRSREFESPWVAEERPLGEAPRVE